MGSRGASLGIAKNGKPYGAEFKTIYQWGNIKFVAPTDQSSEGKAPMETRTKGRVYVTVARISKANSF